MCSPHALPATWSSLQQHTTMRADADEVLAEVDMLGEATLPIPGDQDQDGEALTNG